MNKILEIHGSSPIPTSALRSLIVCTLDPAEDDSDLICQAGTRWEDINYTLKEKGIPLFFPVCAYTRLRAETPSESHSLRSSTLDQVP